MIRLFLSASIPLPDRDPKYFLTADVMAIRDAIKALVSVALADGIIVFGGHPAITPLIALLLEGMAPEAKQRVILYQSAFFQREFPEINAEYINLRIVSAIEGDRSASLERLRLEMIRSEKFDAAIFIGGMEGIWDEYRLFKDIHPTALCLPIGSTGAAALELHHAVASHRRDLVEELTYPTLFYNLLADIRRQVR